MHNKTKKIDEQNLLWIFTVISINHYKNTRQTRWRRTKIETGQTLILYQAHSRYMWIQHDDIAQVLGDHSMRAVVPSITSVRNSRRKVTGTPDWWPPELLLRACFENASEIWLQCFLSMADSLFEILILILSKYLCWLTL